MMTRRGGSPFYTTILFCPGYEAMMIIVASPSCTAYLWGSLIAFYTRGRIALAPCFKIDPTYLSSQKGTDVKEIQKLPGHFDIKITRQYFTKQQKII